MGLFGKLFEKKECAICGGEIGLLGNRKLADGNLCKNCAAKLSPFMTDRRTSTVEEIQEHLEYRRQNEKEVERFHPTRTLGTRTKVYIDDPNRRFAVSSRTSWRDSNPDIIPIDQVIACDVNVHESKREQFQKDAEGKQVSYNPPRYKYEYRFDVCIKVDSPYFDEIRFELTDEKPENRYTDLYRHYEAMAEELRQALKPGSVAPAFINGGPESIPRESYAGQPVQPQQQAPQADQWRCSCGAVNTGRFCQQCGSPKPVAGCAQCGWTPAAGESLPRFCPNCGARLS